MHTALTFPSPGARYNFLRLQDVRGHTTPLGKGSLRTPVQPRPDSLPGIEPVQAVLGARRPQTPDPINRIGARHCSGLGEE